MNALPQRNYKDPLDKILADEEETCKGCRWRKTDHPFSVAICTKPMTEQLRADKRCTDYEEQNP